MAEGLHTIELRLEGPDLAEMIPGLRLYYYQFMKGILGPNGPAQSSTYELKDRDNEQLLYDVTVDTLMYPKVDDYAKAIKNAMQPSINDRKISYSVGKTTGENPVDLITISLPFSRSEQDVISEIQEGIDRYLEDQKLIKQYNRALEREDAEEVKRLRSLISPVYFENEEEEQRVEVSPITSAAETELQKRATEVEAQPEAEQKPTPVPPSKEEKKEPIPPAVKKQEKPVPAPVIISPTEKMTISTSKETAKDRSFVESVSSSVFDKKILDYVKESETVPAIVPSTTTALTERDILRETRTEEKKEATQEGGLVSLLQSIIPTSGLMGAEPGSLINGIKEQATVTIANSISDLVRDNVTIIKSTVDSASDATRSVKDAVQTFSSMVKDGSATLQSMTDSASKSISSLMNVISASNEKTADRESSAVVTEKSDSISSILSEIQNRVMKMESVPPIADEIKMFTTNVGDVIKKAVTTVTNLDKTVSSSQSKSGPTVASERTDASTSVSNREENNMNVGDQISPSIFSNTQQPPSVVSLSQSTIDSLASAIIKNMSIAPFLNSGR